MRDPREVGEDFEFECYELRNGLANGPKPKRKKRKKYSQPIGWESSTSKVTTGFYDDRLFFRLHACPNTETLLEGLIFWQVS